MLAMPCTEKAPVLDGRDAVAAFAADERRDDQPLLPTGSTSGENRRASASANGDGHTLLLGAPM